MSAPFDVRGAVLTDAPEVARLFAQLGHEVPAGSPEARLAAFLESGETILVASRAGSEVLLGAVSIHIMPVLHRASPIGRFTAVVVDEKARGEGIGTILVNAGESYLRSRGCAMIEVTSNKKRTDAHAFYERLGYTATSFRFAKAGEGDRLGVP